MPKPRSRRVFTRLGVIPRALPRWWRAGVLAALLMMPHAQPALAAPLHVVGVPDFSLRGPTPSISGFAPGQFAADEVSRMLPGAAHGPLEVVPRRVVREAQASMNWRGPDALRTDRLVELAAKVGADHLVAGQIERLDVERSQMSGGSRTRATAVVQVLLFDAAGKRFTAVATGNGSVMAPSVSAAAQQALRQAVTTALKNALAKLTPAR